MATTCCTPLLDRVIPALLGTSRLHPAPSCHHLFLLNTTRTSGGRASLQQRAWQLHYLSLSISLPPSLPPFPPFPPRSLPPSLSPGFYWVDPNLGCSQDAVLVHCNFSSGLACISPNSSRGQGEAPWLSVSWQPSLADLSWFSQVTGHKVLAWHICTLLFSIMSVYPHTLTLTHTCTHTHTRMHSHTHTHTHTHTHMHSHTHSHTCTHTHTCTPSHMHSQVEYSIHPVQLNFLRLSSSHALQHIVYHLPQPRPPSVTSEATALLVVRGLGEEAAIVERREGYQWERQGPSIRIPFLLDSSDNRLELEQFPITDFSASLSGATAEDFRIEIGPVCFSQGWHGYEASGG